MMPFYRGYFGFDPTYLLVIAGALLSMWASARVNGTFQKYSQVQSRTKMTGADAARQILRSQGIFDVTVRGVRGQLTDHYDPRDNTIRLSQSVYSATTVAAVGVAAHEAGHAVQYAVRYAPVRLRSAIVPVTNLGSRCSMILLLIGLLFYSQSLFLAGILLFSLTTFFQLVTLPVEFNASRRALETIESRNLLDDEELAGARKVLRAAALTYVAALLMSALQLLRYVLIFLGRNGGRDGRRGGGRG